ncbi:S-adenosyl-L-methionine-dependent methyltransferase [Hygrophoropsis aurantiaca]|uniref:S-adenosyl-L-methionine-dependent methyltransferase n=1 Tax=Hygrophoropsis aurantiaca TaxID=72124 RepID=A0ACB8AFB2_9AGAM|nr:S-adenosyl-L-methionine-dependent methyltransferase [Hygrophoropsis aurantiaca]
MRREPVRQLFARLTTLLGSESANLELKWMKQAHVTSTFPTDLSTMLERRLRGEPLQYILGTTPFGPLELLTRSPTLIPRPETEDWTMRLANVISPTSNRPISILDICTGSGCIPLLLCHLWPPGSTRAYGVDISPAAIRLSIDNAAKCEIPAPTHISERFSRNTFLPVLHDIFDADFWTSLHPPFDVVTSNPPYIPHHEYEQLPASVKDHEDPKALLGDPPGSSNQDGLSFYEHIAFLIGQKGILKDNGVVALEVGQGQADAVEKILHKTSGLRKTEIWKDPWDKHRVVVGYA